MLTAKKLDPMLGYIQLDTPGDCECYAANDVHHSKPATLHGIKLSQIANSGKSQGRKPGKQSTDLKEVTTCLWVKHKAFESVPHLFFFLK